MFVLESCVASSSDVVRHYGRAKAQPAQELLFGPSPFLKFRSMYPHFVRQLTDTSCSVASVTTVVNAARASMRRVPVTQDQVLRSDPSGAWVRATKDAQSEGVDLNGMALHVMQAFHSQVTKRVNVDVRRMGSSRLEYVAALQTALAAGEADPSGSYIIINALQSKLFADGEAHGHMSVLAAWDAKRNRVLVLDVDNRNPLPFWVNIDVLVDAMATIDDMTGEPRGYLLIHT